VSVVLQLFELLGWGSKSQGIPAGQQPQTFQNLCKILFNYYSKIDFDDALQETINSFYKLYFLFFGIITRVCQTVKYGSMELSSLLEQSASRFEDVLSKFTDRCNLDRYLVENFDIDIELLSVDKSFQIWLPDNVCESTVLTSERLLSIILRKLSMVRKFSLSDYKPYYTNGKLITNVNITVNEFGKKAIYLLPFPPQPSIAGQAVNLKVDETKKPKKSRSNSTKTMKPIIMNFTKRPSKPSMTTTKQPLKLVNTVSPPSGILNLVKQELEMASSETEYDEFFIPYGLHHEERSIFQSEKTDPNSFKEELASFREPDPTPSETSEYLPKQNE